MNQEIKSSFEKLLAKEPVQALTYLEQQFPDPQNDLQALAAFARTYRTLGRPEEAMKILKPAVTKLTGSTRAEDASALLSELVLTYAKQDNSEEVIRLCSEFKAFLENDKEVSQALTNALLERGLGSDEQNLPAMSEEELLFTSDTYLSVLDNWQAEGYPKDAKDIIGQIRDQLPMLGETLFAGTDTMEPNYLVSDKIFEWLAKLKKPMGYFYQGLFNYKGLAQDPDTKKAIYWFEKYLGSNDTNPLFQKTSQVALADLKKTQAQEEAKAAAAKAAKAKAPASEPKIIGKHIKSEKSEAVDADVRTYQSPAPAAQPAAKMTATPIENKAPVVEEEEEYEETSLFGRLRLPILLIAGAAVLVMAAFLFLPKLFNKKEPDVVDEPDDPIVVVEEPETSWFDEQYNIFSVSGHVYLFNSSIPKHLMLTPAELKLPPEDATDEEIEAFVDENDSGQVLYRGTYHVDGFSQDMMDGYYWVHLTAEHGYLPLKRTLVFYQAGDYFALAPEINNTTYDCQNEGSLNLDGNDFTYKTGDFKYTGKYQPVGNEYYFVDAKDGDDIFLTYFAISGNSVYFGNIEMLSSTNWEVYLSNPETTAQCWLP
ncbi:MAG: tetratricopeptide repeat protein [Erysipelotrichaceae bacterium]|jgi:TPR repeat protein|nr:tetratricopeptide repeat protein [Erysipelotrichaceae bacterium]